MVRTSVHPYVTHSRAHCQLGHVRVVISISNLTRSSGFYEIIFSNLILLIKKSVRTYFDIQFKQLPY